MSNVIQSNSPNIPTMINSGALDHCFINKASFIKLMLLSQPTMGLAAGKELTFKVLGKGKAEIGLMVNRCGKVASSEGRVV